MFWVLYMRKGWLQGVLEKILGFTPSKEDEANPTDHSAGISQIHVNRERWAGRGDGRS